MKTYARYKDSGISWIGKIPEHWDIIPFREGFELGKGLPITKDDLIEKCDNAVPVISYGQIHSKINDGTYLKEELLRYVDSKFLESNPQSLLKKDDIIFADTSEDLDGCGNCVRNTVNGNVFAGYHTVIARLKKKSMGPYLSYLFQSDKWRSQIRTTVNGVKVYSVTRGHLRRCKLFIPPIEEQKSIVAYLDEKTEQINRLVAAKQKQIELLKEYKQSLIANAVTKGINPKAKMKDSGISWVGQVPAHWDVKRNKVFLEEKDATVGSRFNEFKLLSLTKQGVVLRDVESGKGKFPKDFENYKIVEKGNMIFCLFDVDETPRTVGLSNLNGMITGAYDVFSLRNVDPMYYLFLFLSIDDCKALRPLYTGLRKVVKKERFLSYKIPVPPIDEQKQIVAYINGRVSSIDSQISSIEKQIANLNEYKQSLISDVVTGKVRV